MFRNAFGQSFTAQQALIANLLHLNLNDPLGLRHFQSLPSGYHKPGRRAVARSRYTPAGPARNTHAAINDRRIRGRAG